MNNNATFKLRLYRWVLQLLGHIESLPRTITAATVGRQLVRSGTSMLANYVEAQAASSRKDFINYFTIALKSANESKMWLSILRDRKIGKREGCVVLLSELIELANILGANIVTMKKSK